MRGSAVAMQVSIILPALNETAAMQSALKRLVRQAPEAERIVVDGGSHDDTARQAAALAQVIAAPRGRARQMNRGAEVARGAWLLFLHVDTLLPDGFLGELERAQALGFRAGAFQLSISGRHPLLPVLALGANLRTRLTGIALGDQALFVERALFERLGGYPDLPLLEDYAFTRRLRGEHIALYLARSAVQTSGRRWDQAGFWRTWWKMRRLTWRFLRTGQPGALASGYPDIR